VMDAQARGRSADAARIPDAPRGREAGIL